jgi:hypothetical protein
MRENPYFVVILTTVAILIFIDMIFGVVIK